MLESHVAHETEPRPRRLLQGFAALVLVTAAVSFGSVSASASGEILYQNTFTSGAGPEWSTSAVDTSPSGEAFLGQFDSNSATLTLTDLPTHGTITVTFSLYVIHSMDGNGVSHPVPDEWYARDDSPGGQGELLRTTFSNCVSDNQAYPGSYPGGSYAPGTGAIGTGGLGYLPNCSSLGGYGDTEYSITLTFPHASSTLAFTVGASGPDGWSEGWGIDNVALQVNVLPICQYNPNALSNGCVWLEVSDAHLPIPQVTPGSEICVFGPVCVPTPGVTFGDQGVPVPSAKGYVEATILCGFIGPSTCRVNLP